MRHAHAPRSADTQHVLLQHRRMIRHALLRGLRRQGRRGAAAGPACLAAGNGDFRDKQNRLLAEIGYQTTFRPGYATSNGAYESGLVAGAKVSWADDSTLRLKRRAILKWEDGRPSRILIVKKPGDMAAAQKLQEIGQWLAQNEVQVLVERPVAAAEAKQFEAFDPEVHTVDLAITLGGDGTVLHLASLFKEDAPLPPTLSFAMGTLGFLTPFNASMSRAVLSRLLWPPWEDEPVFCTLRSRKRCEVHHAGQLQRVHSVLNECTVDRGASPAIVMLECFVDGRHVTTVHADALIISTPSGSTAYSMSAGGPMVAPSVPCTILTPVAPQSLSFRPLVVPETAVIEVHLPAGARASAARASFDGRHTMRMRRGSSIVCSTSRYALPMINMHPLDGDWYEGITAKLRWTGSITAGQSGFQSPGGR